jgi:hypothetical protein
MTKAKKFAKFSGDEFMCSVGWFDRFKLHHNISFRKVSGEPSVVNSDTTTEWLNAMWSSVHKGYADSHIFNANQTGIFFRLTPDKTITFKGEKYVGGKLSKNCITALLCANADGTEKSKLPVIGNSKNPDVLNT